MTKEKIKLIKNIKKDLNKEFENSLFYFKLEKSCSPYYANACYYIKLKKDKFIQSSLLNFTDNFYKKLEKFLLKYYKIKGINYNNTRDTFWFLLILN